jgi:hypothetical protein
MFVVYRTPGKNHDPNAISVEKDAVLRWEMR